MSDRSARRQTLTEPITRRRMIAGLVGLAGVAKLTEIAGGRQSTPISTAPYGRPIVSLDRMPGFDAARDSAIETAWLSTLIYDSPFHLNTEGEIRGGVVINWKVSADGLQIDLLVRPDAVFSDGMLVTAADVAASIERCRSVGTVGGGSPNWDRIAGVETIEGAMVRISLTQPDVTILSSLASARAPVVPRHWGDREWSGTREGMPPGSGPFTLAAVDEQRITLDRHPGYRQMGRPHLTGVVVTGRSETVPRATELVTGAVDLVVDASLLDIPTLRDDPNLTLVGGWTNRLCFLAVNHRHGTLRDRSLRLLVSSAIDRAALLDAAVASEGEPATGLFPEDSWVRDGEPLPEGPRLSPEQIRAELLSLGFPTGLPLHLVADEADASLANACILLQEQFAHAGIALTLDLLNQEGLAAAMREGSWDMLAMYSDFWRDPDELLRPLLRGDGDANLGGYHSDRVTSLIDRATTTPDRPLRAQLYQVLQEIVRDEVLVIPLFFPAYYDAMTRRITGYVPYPPVTALAMRQVRMEPPDPRAS